MVRDICRPAQSLLATPLYLWEGKRALRGLGEGGSAPWPESGTGIPWLSSLPLGSAVLVSHHLVWHSVLNTMGTWFATAGGLSFRFPLCSLSSLVCCWEQDLPTLLKGSADKGSDSGWFPWGLEQAEYILMVLPAPSFCVSEAVNQLERFYQAHRNSC